MSATARWIVGIAGLLLALTGFVSLGVGAHVWTALVLGGIVGVIGFEAARRTASWQGALVTLVAVWIVCSSFVGGVQTGGGHLLANLLAGVTLIGIDLFVHDEEVRRV